MSASGEAAADGPVVRSFPIYAPPEGFKKDMHVIKFLMDKLPAFSRQTILHPPQMTAMPKMGHHHNRKQRNKARSVLDAVGVVIGDIIFCRHPSYGGGWWISVTSRRALSCVSLIEFL